LQLKFAIPDVLLLIPKKHILIVALIYFRAMEYVVALVVLEEQPEGLLQLLLILVEMAGEEGVVFAALVLNMVVAVVAVRLDMLETAVLEVVPLLALLLVLRALRAAEVAVAEDRLAPFLMAVVVAESE
jgi:hypothetical protein